MTIEYVILMVIGVALLVASTRLLETESDPTIRAWTLGWSAFITAAVLGTAIEHNGREAMQLPLAIAYAASSSAPICFLFGVFALVSLRPPGWLLPLAIMLVAARTLFGVMGDHVTSEALGVPVESASQLVAAWLVWRWARRRDRPGDKFALAGAFLFVAIGEGMIAVTLINGWDPAGAKIMLTGATVALAGAQLVVVLRRSSAILDQMVADRERELALLRDLAQLGTRHTTAPGLVTEAADLLSHRLGLGWAGFWRWDEAERRLVATRADRIPEDVRARVEAPEPGLAADTCTGETPKTGDASPGAEEIGRICEALEAPGHHLVPLEWQGDVLGVLGVGRSDGHAMPDYVRSILPTLAGELSLTLRHVLSIQQRDRANLDLIRERLKLEAVFETAPLGLLVTNGSGQIELMNRAVGEHMGCGTPEAWIGRPVQAFMDDVLDRIDDPDTLVDRIRQEIDRTGTFADIEVAIDRPEPRTILLFSSRVLGDDGRLTARVWASRDVTTERLLGDQLRHAQKLETIGTLSGGIAHDFNNQLAVILGNVRFARDHLERDPDDLDDVNEALVDLERAADHCAQLTRSLLSFARRAPVALGLVSPAELVRDLGELLRPLIPTSIELHCETEGELPPIMADSAQLQQVLVNLALNARDAIEHHGEIRVGVGVEQLTPDRVARSGHGRPGRHLVMRVSDNGCGVDAEALGRVFEPFYTTKAVGQGTGLGLAIVHGVVTAHSGWIEVESEPGEGTEFRIHLPVEEDAPAMAATPTDPRDEIALATAADARDLVLVADDDDAVRNMLVRALERDGFDVEAVADGEAAVKRFAERPDEFAAVLLDWSMPGLEGPEAAAEIRRMVADVPILLTTGHGEIETDDDLEIIAKPFELAHLARRIRSCIASR